MLHLDIENQVANWWHKKTGQLCLKMPEYCEFDFICHTGGRINQIMEVQSRTNEFMTLDPVYVNVGKPESLLRYAEAFKCSAKYVMVWASRVIVSCKPDAIMLSPISEEPTGKKYMVKCSSFTIDGVLH